MVIELSNTEIETAIEISKVFRKFILVKLKIDIDFDYLD
jgi:hypothetical protein